jgi:hypothetical protein
MDNPEHDGLNSLFGLNGEEPAGPTPPTAEHGAPAASGGKAREPHPRKGERRAKSKVSADDIFDPDRLRLRQDFGSQPHVRRVLTSVPVRRPDRAAFVRSHADPAYRIDVGVVELREEGVVYLVVPELAGELATEPAFCQVELNTAVTRQGAVFLWPIKRPGPDGRISPWHESAIEAVELARTRWVRVKANMGIGAYEVFEAVGSLDEPAWPGGSLQDLLGLAFRGRVIDSLDHLVLRRLRGEI